MVGHKGFALQESLPIGAAYGVAIPENEEA
jgi:hypothetical protein